MATITKTFTENQSSSYKSTWTLAVTGTNQTVSGNFNLTFPTLTAKYSQSGNKKWGSVDVQGSLIIGSALTGFSTSVMWSRNYGSMTAGTAYTISRDSSGTGSNAVTLSRIFNANNKTAKTVNVLFSADLVDLSSVSADWDNGYSWSSVSGSNWGTVATVTLNAPPTFTSSQVYFDTPYVYAGYTTASVDVSNISIKYGGDISSVAFTVGNQTVTGSGNGTLSIALTAGGTFTPTVKVTDSRGQVTTKTLNAITVNAYVAPTVSFVVERTDNLGVPNDEGESAVITATFNYTDVVASLTAPTVAVTDQDNIVVTPTITWYINRELTTVISNWSSVSSGVTVYALLDNANHNLFNTQKSYQIALTPNDIRSSGTTITQILGGAFYTVDFLAGGHGIAFGQACTDEGFWCAMLVYLALDCNGTASSDATSGEDMDLFNNIRALGWYNDVIV